MRRYTFAILITGCQGSTKPLKAGITITLQSIFLILSVCFRPYKWTMHNMVEVMHDIILLFYTIWIFSVDKDVYLANWGLVVALIVVMCLLISFLTLLVIVSAVIEAIKKIKENLANEKPKAVNETTEDLNNGNQNT